MTASKVNFFDTKKIEETKSQSTQSTQETREAAETKKLKSSDVYSYAAGGNVAAYGNFQNYDGFVRLSEDKQEEEKGKSLLSSVKSDTADSKAKKSNCQDYSDKASTDVNNVNKNVKKQQQATKTMQNNVTKTVAERTQVDQETESLKSEADSLNSEIASLMAEDGQDYTPQTVADEPQPQAQPQDNNVLNGESGAISSASTGGDAGAATASAPADPTGGMTNLFAMFSLPSGGVAEQSAAPTSETAVSAQNSQAAKDQGAVQQQNGAKQAQQQNGANKNTGVAAGNSLKSFASDLTQPKGKNADKINQLMSQLTSTNSQITSNQTQSAALTQKATKTTSTFQSQLNKIMSQTVAAKSSNQQNYKGAKAAQTTGEITTMTGGIATATGTAMLATSFGSNQLGTALVIGGGAGTIVGTATTTIAQSTQKDTQGAMNTASNGINTLKSDAAALLSAKQMINS